MVDFLIMYEHKVREFDNLCLIKAELENRGYSVEMVYSQELNVLPYHILKKPRVLVTHAFYDDKSFYNIVEVFVGKVKKVVNMQWEQVVVPGDEDDINFKNPSGMAALATHVCWGKSAYERLKKANVKHPVITGAVQLDFLKPRFRGFYMSREELFKKYGFDSRKKTILFISSFCYASMTKEEKEKQSKHLGSSRQESCDLVIQCRKQLIEWFARLLKELQGIQFIYRPHPGENIDVTLKNLKERFGNFFIIGDESVKQWITAVDKVTTWKSTAIIEVYYANKTCGILRPFRLEPKYEDAIYLDGDFITNYADFQKFILDDSYKSEFPLKIDRIEYSYGKNKEGYAYIHIADLLEKVLKSKKYNIGKYKRHSILRPLLKKNIKSVIRKYKITSQSIPFCWTSKKIQDNLDYFWFFEEKSKLDYLHKSEIAENTAKMKKYISVL